MKMFLTTAAMALTAGAAGANMTNFAAVIDGDQNGNDSPATGTLTGMFDDSTNTFSFSWSITDNLNGAPDSPGAHLHNAPAGESGPIVFFMSDGVWDLDGEATWENMTGDEVDALFSGELYANFHTDQFPGGEVRGQINKVPAPGAAALFGLGGLAVARRRR